MNKYSKLNKQDLLEICKIIHPETNWKFLHVIDEEDNCHEYIGDDESIIQFNLLEDESDELRFYYKGDYEGELMVEGEEMVKNSEDKINQYILRIYEDKNILVENNTETNFSISDNDIKNRFVGYSNIDKFTNIEIYQSHIVKLSKKMLDDLAESEFYEESKNHLPKFNLSIYFEYKKMGNDDLLLLKARYSQTVKRGNKLNISLENAKITLLCDKNDIVLIDKVNEFEPTSSTDSYILESIHFETDITLITKIINSNTLEYRLEGNQGIISESKLSKTDLLTLKGFYNSLFDSSFKREELISFLKEEKMKETKKKKIDQEVKKAKKLKQKTNKENEIIQEEAKKVKSSSPCFVVSATMNNPNHPIVNDYRLYRDNFLLKNRIGISFVNLYYIAGPHFAKLINSNEILRKVIYYVFIMPIHKIIQKKNDSIIH